jgi:hypothetical protein
MPATRSAFRLNDPVTSHMRQDFTHLRLGQTAGEALIVPLPLALREQLAPERDADVGNPASAVWRAGARQTLRDCELEAYESAWPC